MYQPKIQLASVSCHRGTFTRTQQKLPAWALNTRPSLSRSSFGTFTSCKTNLVSLGNGKVKDSKPNENVFTRVSEGLTYPFVVAQNSNVVDLPVLSPTISCRVVPRRFSPEEKVISAINRNGKFSGLLHRLRTLGQRNLTLKTGRFVTNPVKPVTVSFVSKNSFGSLSSEDLSNDGGDNPFLGFNVVRKGRTPSVKNNAFAAWCDANIERKVFLHNLKISKQKNKIPVFCSRFAPLPFSDADSVIRNWFHYTVTKESAVQRAFSLSRSFGCPKFSCTVIAGKVSRLLPGGVGEGLTVIFNNAVVAHLGDHVFDPKTDPWLNPLIDEDCVWSSVNIVNAVPRIVIDTPEIGEDQAFLDQYQPEGQFHSDESLSRRTLEERLGLRLTWLLPRANPRTLFAVAMLYKSKWACPTDAKYIISFWPSHGVIKFGKELGGEQTGLYFGINDHDLFHCGSIEKSSSRNVRATMWKAAFFGLSARIQERNFKSTAISSSVGLTTIEAAEPDGFKWGLCGFTVTAKIGGANIYARGSDFTRPADPTGSDSLVSTRQKKIFWKTGGKKLVFTLKGLSKIFWQKKEDEPWRKFIARRLGMSLLGATRKFSEIDTNENLPDMVFEEVGDEMLPTPPKTVFKNVYVEIPVRAERTTADERPLSPSSRESVTFEKIVHTPVSSVPTRSLSSHSRRSSFSRIKVNTTLGAKYFVNGSSWLVGEGFEERSRRALFRETFPNDWHKRISEAAYFFMCADLSRSRKMVPPYDANSLVVDIDKTFDLNLFRNSSPIIGLSKMVIPPEQKKSEIVDLKRAKSNLRPVDQHMVARSSSEADIETNPGPTNRFSDDLTVRHPSPSDFFHGGIFSETIEEEYPEPTNSYHFFRENYSHHKMLLPSRFLPSTTMPNDACDILGMPRGYKVSNWNPANLIEAVGYHETVRIANTLVPIEERSQTKFSLDEFEQLQMLIFTSIRKVDDGTEAFTTNYLREILRTIGEWRTCPDFDNSCAIHFDKYSHEITFHWGLKNRNFVGMWFVAQTCPFFHFGIENPKVFSSGNDPVNVVEEEIASFSLLSILKVANLTASKKADMALGLTEEQHLNQELVFASHDLFFLFFYIYYFFQALFNSFDVFMHPSFNRYHPLVTFSREDYPPDIVPEDSLLIGTLGTHGDQIPVHYYGNLAAHFGVRTHVRNYHHMTSADLEALRVGDMFKCLPGYMDLGYAPSLGYKRVFTPHITVDRAYGANYSLQPGPKWINRISFVDNWKNVDWINIVPSIVSVKMIDIFDPTWRIGALNDCQLPRSCDGKKLLVKRQNKKTGAISWTAGSGNPLKIPKDIRESFLPVPPGDHSLMFQNFDRVFIHGGAGTVQTAIAAGCEPVICDPTLDRNYKRVPDQKDFRSPSVAPFMGWLVWSNFKVDAPLFIKFIWVLSYLWSIKFSLVCSLLFNAGKFYAIQSAIREHWTTLLIICFSISLPYWKIFWKQFGVFDIISVLQRLIWDFPFICIFHSWVGKAMFLVSLKQAFPMIMQDISNAISPKLYLCYEPISRGTHRFWFPFGHWSLLDQVNGDVFEGAFLSGFKIGDPFRFTCSKRQLKAGHILFPSPFCVQSARRKVKENIVKPYSSSHNCGVLAFSSVKARSIIWTVFFGTIVMFLTMALAPPDIVLRIVKKLYPNSNLNETRIYQSLGFAAGIENIPFELEEDPEAGLNIDEKEPPRVPQLEDEESWQSLLDEISIIRNEISRTNVALDEDDLDEAAIATLNETMEKIEVPNKLHDIVELPPYVKQTWSQIVDNIHHAMYLVRHNKVVDCFIAWLRTISANIYEFAFPILDALAYFLGIAISYSTEAFKKLFIAGCDLMDHMWGLEASKRVKTVWGLTGLYRTGVLGRKARLASNIAYSEFVGRDDFESDYNNFVQNVKMQAKKVGAVQKGKIGGPQRRPIGYSKPLMSHNEAKLLGFKEGEYVTDKIYEERVKSYLEQGVPQGGDGVFLADKMPELIAKSQHRYEPKYAALTPNERIFAREIAEAMFDHDKAVFEKCEIVTPGEVTNFIKKKFSPGTPFIKPGGFKSRQALMDAGYDKVLQRNAKEMLETGRYPVQFYHAFVKSQVVDIQKCLPIDQGGKGKDVRTVVSQDLVSYMIDQCIQIERNKRINWDTYGAGIGMPLNQSMDVIYNRMRKAQEKRGGRYIMMDATAFDSFCKPFLFEVNAVLWEMGFRDHPSGNGKAISSVIRASYEARSSGGSWIMGITEPEYRNLVISVPDKNLLNEVHRQNPERTVRLIDLLPSNFFQMNKEAQVKMVNGLDLPEDTTVLSWDPKLRPNKAGWMGSFVIGDTTKVADKFFENQTLTYDKSNVDSLLKDAKAVIRSNYQLTSNVHPKNRGGSTGGSDTSNVNTHAFKAGVIYAWCKTTGRSPKEFFDYNDLANTSDDTIWQSGGKFGLNDIEDIQTFQKHCVEVGIHLTIETTKDISKVEYLSKFVRKPTAEDSAALKAWRTQKINAINHSNRQKGFEGITEEQLETLNNPEYIVVQNPNALLLRRSAFRYYQSSKSKMLYNSVERGAGHALNTAFVPKLYNTFATEWCDDVNMLMEQNHIHRKYQLRIGKYGLSEVMQVDPRASQQSLSPRQNALLRWLKGNMYPSQYNVMNTHMNIAKIDPEKHSKFLKKLERGWRGWDQIMNEGVDQLFALTDSIPDSWSKKFQPSIEMLYAERPFYTRNKYVEKFIYLKLLEESVENEITFSDFSQRVQESPYGNVCDPYHFWEQVGQENFKEELMKEEKLLRIQGMVLLVSLCYAYTHFFEQVVFGISFLGAFYKLFIWSFVGLNKVYGITGTLYWHSEGKSSREISRMMPRDPYKVTKQACAFIVDLIPEFIGYFLWPVILILSLLPPALEMVGKTWFVAGEIKETEGGHNHQENPWDKYPEEYVGKLRESPTGFAYLAAKTGTGKSSWWPAAILAKKGPLRIRKIWILTPRKILRAETQLPFGIKTQELMRKVVIDQTVDVYVMTYGHAINRINEIDPDQDICLFDEFHEESGEMILALSKIKAKSFLLSATPVEIPMLAGSPYLTPNIDQRFPLTEIVLDDSVPPIDMFLEAQNRYPEQCKRALIILPTHKMCTRMVEALNNLKVGPTTLLSSRQRAVPREGIIVATPYVQTGLDLKPACDIIIDSGKDMIIHKGKRLMIKNKETGRSEFPWTDPDTHKQRLGRAGRNRPGIVFRPRSAGTGQKPVKYPAPHYFSHEVVADHFKVESLKPQAGAVSTDLPFISLNTTKLGTLSVRKSVTMIHCLALSGVRQTDWERLYNQKREGKDLGEDYYLIEKTFELSKWFRTQLLPYDQALFHTRRADVVSYNFKSGRRWCLPMEVINGKWTQVDISPTHNFESKDLPTMEIESRYTKIQSQVERFQNILLSQANKMGQAEFARTVEMLQI